MMSVPLFGVCFVGNSFPIPDQNFMRVDPTHWVLDICTAVTPNVLALKEVALFLATPGALPPDAALGVYIKVGVTDWEYRGCVHAGHPSDVMPLQWPQEALNGLAPGPGVVQLGVSLEPVVDLAAKEGSKLGAREDFAKRVGLDLYRYLESFQSQRSGDALIIPGDALDRWFKKFSDKFRRDPDFLTREKEKF